MNEKRHRPRGDSDADALAHLAPRVELAVSWASLALSSSDRDRLRELAANARPAREVTGSGRRRRARLALLGGDANRRIQVAAAFANDAGLGLFRVDLAAVVSKYAGETEKNLARLFDGAQASDAVLLFDEGDALFGERTEVRPAGDRYTGLDTAYLLQRLEECDVCAIVAASRGARVEEGVSSRFDCVLLLDD
jgi:SpoVK/Ycf46/Vps4 family AAA+-type ATPase